MNSDVPLVTDLAPAQDNAGLLLKGYVARWTLDRAGDTFNPFSLDRAVQKYMATNPVLLYSHKYSLPPIGKVTNAEIHRDKGLWIEAIMPRPAEGTFLYEIYDAAKNNVLRGLSLGGKWLKQDKGTHNEILAAEILECSLCSLGVNPDTYAVAAIPTEVKCLSSGTYMPLDEYDRALAAVSNDLAMIEARFAAAAVSLAARQ